MAKKKREETLKLTTRDNILLENNIDMEKITGDLEKYVDERVNKVFIDEIRDVNKKLLREKSKKIFIKNIIIIILLLIIGFLIYLLYSNNYFDRIFNSNTNQIQNSDKKESEEVKEDKKEEVKVKKEPTQEELKKEYAGYLDQYVLNDKSSYLKDFYNGNLTNDLKNYFTLNSLDFDSLKKEDDYHIISSDTFKVAYEKIFDGDYSDSSFDYNGNNIRYVSMMKSYITTKLLTKSDSLIKREIINIKVDGNNILITTIEGLVKDNKLYNVLTDTLVGDYEEGTLSKHSDSLDKVVYTFKNSKLISLSK